MKTYRLNIKLLSIILMMLSSNLALSKEILATANGIQQPKGMKNWRVISTSFRTDNNTQRVILGNSIAIKAAKEKQTDPWPQGTILAKLVWKNIPHPQWNKAIIPGEFVHSEIMIKDKQKYQATGGWGYARWKGLDQTPYGADKSFVQECASCHNQAKGTDFVFTIPAQIPLR